MIGDSKRRSDVPKGRPHSNGCVCASPRSAWVPTTRRNTPCIDCGRIAVEPLQPSKFGIYTRPTPRVHQSGETEYVDGERRSCNRRVKAVLSRATECLIRSNRGNPIKVYYHKQRENGCTAHQAKGRARGKLSNCIYAMLPDGEPCEWSDPAFADRKLAQLERAATAAGASV